MNARNRERVGDAVSAQIRAADERGLALEQVEAFPVEDEWVVLGQYSRRGRRSGEHLRTRIVDGVVRTTETLHPLTRSDLIALEASR